MRGESSAGEWMHAFKAHKCHLEKTKEQGFNYTILIIKKSKEPELRDFSSVDKSTLKSKNGSGRALSNLCVLTEGKKPSFFPSC